MPTREAGPRIRPADQDDLDILIGVECLPSFASPYGDLFRSLDDVGKPLAVTLTGRQPHAVHDP